jgi:hypothetical protein
LAWAVISCGKPTQLASIMVAVPVPETGSRWYRAANPGGSPSLLPYERFSFLRERNELHFFEHPKGGGS